MRSTAVAKIIAYCYFVMHFMRPFYSNDSFFKRDCCTSRSSTRLCVQFFLFINAHFWLCNCHTFALFLVKFIFSGWSGEFLSIKSITSPFIACHARNCHRLGRFFFGLCTAWNSIFDIKWKHLISVTLYWLSIMAIGNSSLID